jgi:hypothetical protein
MKSRFTGTGYVSWKTLKMVPFRLSLARLACLDGSEMRPLWETIFPLIWWRK